MSRRITTLLAAPVLVAGLAVGVPTAVSQPVDHAAADTATTSTATTQTTPSPQQLISLLTKSETTLKQPQKSGKVSPHDLLGLESLLSGVELNVLALLNQVATSVGMPALPGLPGSTQLPVAPKLEQQVKAGKYIVAAPADAAGAESAASFSCLVLVRAKNAAKP